MKGGISNVWFDRFKISNDCPEHLDSINAMCQVLTGLIDDEVRSGIKKSRILVGGFSMGGCMAMHLAYRNHRDVAGVFALSSFLNKASAVYQHCGQNMGTTCMSFSGGLDKAVVRVQPGTLLSHKKSPCHTYLQSQNLSRACAQVPVTPYRGQEACAVLTAECSLQHQCQRKGEKLAFQNTSLPKGRPNDLQSGYGHSVSWSSGSSQTRRNMCTSSAGMTWRHQKQAADRHVKISASCLSSVHPTVRRPAGNVVLLACPRVCLPG
ncbi:lysophospholipase-like protein 1 isoform X9 [Desmodus rotundus]|nr:lysophospholipase-like protein 1 isoform X9 [Desmodus rotundus]